MGRDFKILWGLGGSLGMIMASLRKGGRERGEMWARNGQHVFGVACNSTVEIKGEEVVRGSGPICIPNQHLWREFSGWLP